MVTINALIDKVKAYFPSLNEERVLNAYEFAKQAHKNQKRYSGEPYIIHPLHSAFYLADFHPDEDTLIAALLHDTSEDTDVTLEEIEKHFGTIVAILVSGLEKLGKVRAPLHDPDIQNLQKMFLAMGRDLRIILIKLCDRLHNIQTLEFVPKEKQLRIAKETLEIYAAIAARLGIYRLKIMLEDAAFKFIYPEAYEDIKNQLQNTFKLREDYIESAKEILANILSLEGVYVDISGRLKSIYSIYRKMNRKMRTNIADIFDIFAMRVILPDVFKRNKESVAHIYACLGIIHNHFTPLANRFKDYIAVPKINGYRSLHTTVMGLGPKIYTQPTEIQIRTAAMHEQAEFGIAAHWLYEETRGVSAIPADLFKNEIENKSSIKKHIEWLKGLMNLQQKTESKEEFLKDLRIDIFQDRIFVFTPRGEVKDLPRGSTPVDFAYAVHSEVGNHCMQAKVNGNIVPLNYELKNGEVVEIITSKNIFPSQSWLSFVKTVHAKGRIRAYFKGQNVDKNLRDGKELVNQYLIKIGHEVLSPDLNFLKEVDGKKLTTQERENLLIEVGKGSLLPGALIRKILPLSEILTRTRERVRLFKSKRKIQPSVPRVIVAGQSSVPFRFAKCCVPEQGDKIIGFVTRGVGVTVHKRNCKVVRKLDQKRLQEASWSSEFAKYPVKITLEVSDRVGLLRDIGDAIAKLSLNIEDFSSRRNEDNVLKRDLTVNIDSYDDLDKILSALESVPNVLRAYISKRGP